MKRVAYDIETNGYIDEWTGSPYSVVHCIVLRDLDTDEVRCYHESDSILPRHGGLHDALVVLNGADLRVAHNGIAYDEVILADMGFKSRPEAEVYDTFVMSHYLWPELEAEDKKAARFRSGSEWCLPKGVRLGSHSLEAWGWRLKVPKGDPGGSFDVFTPAMLDYCIQDTAVLSQLFHTEAKRTAKVGHRAPSIRLEHDFAEVLARQERMGIHFDVPAGEALWRLLEGELLDIDHKLHEEVEPWVEHYETKVRKTPKTRTVLFNPGSRVQIAKLYEERYGYKFHETTENGRRVINEAVLKSLALRDLPHAKDIERRFLLAKRLSALAVSKKGTPWLEAVRSDGRVHPRINHHGAVTSRCTHFGFNITGVPRVTSPFGGECRSLFTSQPGWILVGGDAKGLELRMLADRLLPYDGGAYATVVVEGDPHSVHQGYFGFEDHASMSGRDRTKTMFYAWLYGAGSEKLGRVAMDGIKYVTERQAQIIGKDLVASFESRFAGLRELKTSLAIHLTGLTEPTYRTAVINPWVRSYDGRLLRCRSHHSSLNLVLQGGGAIYMKLVTVLTDQRIREHYGHTWRLDYGQVIHAHDEMQFDCRTQQIANDVQESIEWAMIEAGVQLGIKVPMAADVKQGKNWKETH